MALCFGRAIKLALMATCAAAWQGGGAAVAELQITEIMSDPRDENAWEWIEVRNTGAAPIDLDDYIIDRVGDPQSTATRIDGVFSTNTEIPAGGVAVLYDAVLTGPGDYNDQAFRSAWGLSPSVPLIGLPNFGNALTNNPGTAIGFWANTPDYNDDVADDGTGTLRVSQLSNAAFGIDFRTTSGFPVMINGFSATWNGSGSYQAPENWALSQFEVDGAVSSTAVTLPGEQFNSSDDTANPGRLPSGPRASGVLITEIMYNPASPAVGSVEHWEWVEILNNTASPINLANYYLHDNDGADLLNPNIQGGLLPVGEAAVLFSDDITLQDMIDAWDPGEALGTLFVPVSSFPALANSGDSAAIWDSKADYDQDSQGVTGRGVARAAAAVAYLDEGSTSNPTGWPNPLNKASIYLNDLTADPNAGSSWTASVAQDLIGSTTAGIAIADVEIHGGDDVGSPGAFGLIVDHDADLDGDSDVDGQDFLVWQRGVGVGTNHSSGDIDGNGMVDGADLSIWKAQFGPAASAAAGGIPEPAGGALVVWTMAGLLLARNGARS